MSVESKKCPDCGDRFTFEPCFGTPDRCGDCDFGGVEIDEQAREEQSA